MGEESQAIRDDIERVRGDLGETLDAIGDRVRPGRIVERRVGRVRDRVTSVREAVMGRAEDAYGTAGDRVSGIAGSAREGASGVTDRVSSAAGTAVGQVRETPQVVRRQTQGNPLAAGLVAFGAGLVVASLLPASQREAEAAHRVVETAKDKGAPLMDEAKAAGQQLGQDLKERATEAAQQVKDSAADSAQQVKGEAQSSADTVKSEATPSNG